MLKYLSQVGLATAMFVLLSGGNIAQAKDSSPEPDGIQAGGFVIHPGFSVAAAYDSDGSHGIGDGNVDLGVHLNTRLVDEKTKSWDNSLEFNWKQYWGIGKAKPEGGPDVKVSTNADLFKQSLVRFSPSASYSYLNDPEDDNLRQDFINHYATAGAAFYIQPSGGAVFSQRIAYNFAGRFYEKNDDVSHMTHRFDAVTRWNFLPQTSMSLTVDFRITHYLQDVRYSGGDGTQGLNSTSMPVRVKYSLQGLILPRLSYQLGLGYAYENFENGLNEHMFIMNAKLKYNFAEKKALSLEYKKDFNNAVYDDYYKNHIVALNFDALWFDHLQTDINAGFGAFDFISLDTGGKAQRTDYLINAGANIYYHFLPGIKLGLQYKLRYNMSNYQSGDYFKNTISLNFAYEY